MSSTSPSYNLVLKTPIRQKKGALCACLSIVTIVILFCFGITVLFMQRYLETYRFYAFYRGDVIDIRDTVHDFSTNLCSGYEVDPFLEADVYLIPHKATTDNKNRKISLNKHNDLYSGIRYEYQAMNLFAGSKISARGCKKPMGDSHVLVEVLVFEGDDSWNEWKDSQRCTRCAAASVTIHKNETCDHGLTAELEYLVTKTATYYVAVARTDPSYVYKTVYFEVSVTLNRTTLDVTKATRWCLRTTNCSFPLDYDSDQDIVVDIPDNSILERDVGSHCQPRVILWVGVFAIFPLSLILLLFACCGCCYLADKGEEQRTFPPQTKVQGVHSASDTAELVQNDQLAPAYDPVVGNVQNP